MKVVNVLKVVILNIADARDMEHFAQVYVSVKIVLIQKWKFQKSLLRKFIRNAIEVRIK